MNLLGHGRGEHPGVGSGVGHHLALVELLNHLQSLVRADLEHLGAVVLQLRQVVEQGRGLGLLLFLLGGHRGRHRRVGSQFGDQLLSGFPLLEAVLLVEEGRAEVG